MTAPRIPRRAYIPAGCDQQGRHRETGRFVAAEAATEVGADEPDFRRSAKRALVFWLLACCLAVGFVAGVIYGGLVDGISKS